MVLNIVCINVRKAHLLNLLKKTRFIDVPAVNVFEYCILFSIKPYLLYSIYYVFTIVFIYYCST